MVDGLSLTNARARGPASTHLVHVGGVDVEDPIRVGKRHTTGSFDKERDGRSLVQEPELSVDVLGVGRVAEDPAVKQSAVDVADHRSEVARRVLLAGFALTLLHGGDVVAKLGLPV